MGSHDNQRMLAPHPAPAALNGAVSLSDWGLIRATGDEARHFLHGQLTQDVEHLAPGQARLAGYCTPKGRLLASFVMWLDAGGDVLLACSADVLPATLKRLSMFVMRAKCKLSDASDELPLHGLAGSALPAAVAAAEPWGVIEGRTVRLPDAGGVPRALALDGPVAGEALDPEVWRWLEVASALPRVVGATVEQFVPQMINLEVVGGVNFQKGCYPGQEIVARSQYRGTVKRRAFVATAEFPMQPGQAIVDAADPDQPAGQVVLAAAPAGVQPAALIELKLAAAEAELHAGAADGPRLQLGALPYALPTEPA
jgi:hypothetical protein